MNPGLNEIQQVADFCRWFTQKAQAEFPRLSVITAVYTEQTWPECRKALLSEIHEERAQVSEQSLYDLTVKPGSQAALLQPPLGEGRQHIAVIKINLDDCRTGYWGDPVTEAKSVVCHEGGHVVGALIRGLRNSLYEENSADIFEMLMMSSLGYGNNHQAMLKMRVLNRNNPEKLGVQGRYGFPAIYDEAVKLSKQYLSRKSVESLQDILEESDEFVEQRSKLLNDWFGFIDGIYALSGETKKPEDILGAAVKARHPHAGIITRVSGFTPNMDFEPAHSPNPFLSRRAASEYPSSFKLMGKVETVDVPISRPPENSAGIEWPPGYTLLLPEGGAIGTYNLRSEPSLAPDVEPHFS